MHNKSANRGLRNTGRYMVVICLGIFSCLMLIIAFAFVRMAHTGFSGDHDLLSIALQTQLRINDVTARRGRIIDANGELLASQHPSYTMYANFNPNWGTVVEDKIHTARMLSEVINSDFDTILVNLSTGAYQPRFGNAGLRLSFMERRKIEELELPGIYFDQELTRFYPQGVFASHTIGYTKFGAENTAQHGRLIGAMGLEAYFNDILTGRNGRYQFRSDGRGFVQPDHERIYIVEPLDGYDIRLPIQSRIQFFLEEAMDRVVEKAAPESIVAVVMNPTTGEILAAGSRPTFDPNHRNPEFYANAIYYPFDPGSTFKIFTYAAAINEGNYVGSQLFRTGSRLIPGGPIFDHSGINRNTYLTFDDGFFRSSNTSVIDLLRDSIGYERFMDYLDDFGFGKITDFPSIEEHSGTLPNFGPNISLAYLYTATYGQGITVTPLQMLQATSAMLNNGEMVRPQIIADIYNPNTNEYTHQFKREVVGNPITPETARQMRTLMEGVVHNEFGTAHVNYMLNVRSGGKTGTSQIPGGPYGFLVGQHIYSYIGFAPADAPELIMFVSVRNPTISYANGHVYSGYIYRSVMNNTLSYLGLTHNNNVNNDVFLHFETIPTPRLFNLTIDDAVEMAKSLDLIPVVIGTGPSVFNQAPVHNSSIIIGDKIFLQTDIEDFIPDFRGWSRAQINQYQQLLGIEIEIIGHGVGVSQSLRPGRIIRAGDSISVTLQ